MSFGQKIPLAAIVRIVSIVAILLILFNFIGCPWSECNPRKDFFHYITSPMTSSTYKLTDDVMEYLTDDVEFLSILFRSISSFLPKNGERRSPYAPPPQKKECIS